MSFVSDAQKLELNRIRKTPLGKMKDLAIKSKILIGKKLYNSEMLT